MVVSTTIPVSDFYRCAVSAVGVVVGVFVPARGRRPLVIGHPVVNVGAVAIDVVVNVAVVVLLMSEGVWGGGRRETR